MRLTRHNGRRGRLGRLLAGALALALPLAPLAAQRRAASEAPVKEDPVSGRKLDLRAKRTFSLFGLGDVAISGSKGFGDIGMAFTNFGLCGADGNEITFPCPAGRRRDGSIVTKGFAYEFTAAVSRSDFRKLRTLYPGIANAVGGGYTGHYALSGSGFTGTYDFGPADRSVGRLFSGITTTVGDNSCRDKSGIFEANYDNFAGALNVLAGSDCPETWAPGVGFEGARRVDAQQYLNEFTRNRSSFDFDFWRIPREELTNNGYLGSFSTYYETTDFFAENIRDFGGVTRLATGTPRLRGFPIGLTLRVDAFVSNVPLLSNAIFYQVLVINNSADVYGEPGVDYDSLYFGIIEATSTTSFRGGNHYYDPSIGGSIETGVGVNANCNNARIVGGIFGACNTGSQRGFFWGGEGFLVLKSPIGDLRNKLFTREGSAFYDPTHPNRGDTITFNHGHRCGFIICSSVVNDVSERSQYGYIASREEDVLDGRVASDFAPEELWRVFHNATAGNTTPAGLPEFNRFVPPGGWDYNKDGVLDTLRLDSCHLNGCVPRWSDTLPGGQVNRLRGSGTGQTTVAGPFKLGSRDTTAFVFAVVGARDSVPFEAAINNTLNYYLNFYASASAPPPPSIVAAEVPPASEQFRNGGQPFVRLAFGSETESFVDAYFFQIASAVETETAFEALRTLNPFLPDSIRALAARNVAEIQIYRSCDNGVSWDADGDCRGDRAVGPDGLPIGTGWQPDEILRPAPGTNDFPNTYVDNNVVAGRTYLYATVAKSRGATFSVRDVNQAGDTVTTTFTVADALVSSLSTSGANTRRVYVPVTATAGLTPATVAVTRVSGPGVSTAPVTVRLTSNPVAGRYRLEFGNQFEIREAQSTTSGGISSRVTVRDTLPACTVSGTATTPCTVSTLVSSATTDRIPVSTSAEVVTTTTAVGDSVIRTRRIDQFGFVLLQIVDDTARRPIFVSTSLSPDSTTPPELLGSSLSRGFSVRVDNSPTATNAVAFEAVVTQPNGDTLNATILNNAVAQLQEARGARNPAVGGVVEFTFQADPFNAPNQFRLDVANPQATQTAVTAALNARPGQTTSTSARLAEILGNFNPAFAGLTLTPTRLPFTGRNTTTGDTLIFAAALRPNRTILLGAQADTVRVAVPEGVWVPGDSIFAFAVTRTDSIVGGRPLVDPSSGTVVQKVDTIVAFAPLVIGCNAPRITCNPVALATPGGTGYRPYKAGEKLVVGFNRTFSLASAVDVVVTAPTPRNTLSAADRNQVSVVPNPYIVQSAYDVVDNNRVGESRVLFTGMPPRGTLRIYSVSGQFLQQLTWTEADLNGTGDLPYNLRTREGTELATGLYIYVIEGTTGAGGKQTVRGRFVVIR